MNKKKFAFIIIVFLVLLNTLVAAAHEVRGMWDLQAVIFEDNVTLNFYALFVGDQGNGTAVIASFAKNATTPEGLMGDFTVAGDNIIIVKKGGGETLTGTFSDEDNISGTWMDGFGAESGTWKATRKFMPVGTDVDVRGMWLFVWGMNGNPLWYMGYPGTFSGDKNSGVLKFSDIITGEMAFIGNQLDFTVTGNEIAITTTDGSGEFTGKFLDNYAMSGEWESDGFGTGRWGAFRMSQKETNPPFGSFDTPLDGTTVSGSIAVTGWALDDSALAGVKIYRKQGDALIYIGDASFVEGARPDVAAAFPEYPANTKAGWGYMLLTNFLPGEGNGSFVLSAIATDLAGKTTELGTKTIVVDNAHAIKPFGAIYTPTQGGIAFGKSFINWGWVLTPQPNTIPINGTTINVWVNGVNIGHPNYNLYRADIATLFPAYANSNGAVGYFYLDTTKYPNGVHTIQWTATDSAGNTDGIGSRYFTIQNPATDRAGSATIPRWKMNFKQIAPLTKNFSEPLKIKKDANECQEFQLEKNGDSPWVITFVSEELEGIEIQLGDNYADIQGYMIGGDKLYDLPIGSTLNVKSGTFSWSPGPGFVGSYALVFEITESTGHTFKKYIKIQIEPKFKKR